MEQFQIREMRETDIAQVEAIEQEIFSVPWSEKSFLSTCTTPENIYLVCLAGEEVAGYCGLWSVLGEGNITNMAVAEKYRRNGVAEALMKEMEERGRQKDVTIFFLEVRESNDAARRLYEKMGYEQIGVRKNFYREAGGKCHNHVKRLAYGIGKVYTKIRKGKTKKNVRCMFTRYKRNASVAGKMADIAVAAL